MGASAQHTRAARPVAISRHILLSVKNFKCFEMLIAFSFMTKLPLLLRHFNSPGSMQGRILRILP